MFTIHNYFLAKTLDQLRPSGIMAFVTSRYTMDSKDSAARKYLAERADLLGAIRLPNTAFKANAGTDVVADILFLQKREEPAVGLPDWVGVMENQDGYPVNAYFNDHPEMVLDCPGVESTRYGHDYTVYPSPGADLARQLHEAAARVRGQYRVPEVAELEAEEAAGETIPADPSVKNYSYAVVDGAIYYRESLPELGLPQKATLWATWRSASLSCQTTLLVKVSVRSLTRNWKRYRIKRGGAFLCKAPPLAGRNNLP